MKGQQQALSVILISGVMIAVVGSVYMWGIPLIEKNRDIAILINSKRFMQDLTDKIKYVANHGGKDKIMISVPGELKLDNKRFLLTLETKGTMFSVGGWIPLGKNSCIDEIGSWGEDNPETICARSLQLDGNSYSTTYSLKFIRLDSGIEAYKIDLDGGIIGEENTNVVLENRGVVEVIEDGKTVLKTIISVSRE